MSRRTKSFSSRLGVALSVIVLAAAASGCAQRTFAFRTPQWELEVHGGGGFASEPSGGAGSLPEAGRTFTTAFGAPSRQAPSWYFGDGAALLNQVNAALGLPARIIPLDRIATSSLVDPPSGANVGLRLNRVITPRFTGEFSFDYSLARHELNQAALAGIDEARSSFSSAWTALFATGPFMASNVTSERKLEESDQKQILASATLNVNLKTSGRAIPYAAIGAGFAHNLGELPSASITGRYRFQPGGLFQVDETDVVTLRSRVQDGVMAVVGGGVKYLIARRWGLRFDARAHLGNVESVTTIQTAPKVHGQRTTGVTASLTTPSVQFSSNGSIGPSSLAGPFLNDFQSFNRRSMQTRLHITAGAFFRF
jgi:hypothetical protein